MRRTIIALVVISTLGLVSPVDASQKCDSKKQKCPATAIKYKNCTELRKAHSRGVARDAAAAGSSGATVDAAIYKANVGSDRDKDGVACEK